MRRQLKTIAHKGLDPNSCNAAAGRILVSRWPALNCKRWESKSPLLYIRQESSRSYSCKPVAGLTRPVSGPLKFVSIVAILMFGHPSPRGDRRISGQRHLPCRFSSLRTCLRSSRLWSIANSVARMDPTLRHWELLADRRCRQSYIYTITHHHH